MPSFDRMHEKPLHHVLVQIGVTETNDGVPLFDHKARLQVRIDPGLSQYGPVREMSDGRWGARLVRGRTAQVCRGQWRCRRRCAVQKGLSCVASGFDPLAST